MKNLQQITIKLLTICSFMHVVQVLSAQTVDKYYVNMPDEQNPTLSKQNRLELIEYHKAGKGDSIANRFGNQAILLSLDTLNNRLAVKNTPSSTFEMKMLSMNDSIQTIGIIRTVCGSICQSSVEFYDTVWHQIPLQFTMPKAVNWLNEVSLSTASVDQQWVRNVLGTSFVSLSFDTTKQQITAKNNSLEFLSESDRKIISPFVIDKLLNYKLVGRTWILEP
ncbi:MAG: DUF3256 family protein [Paludibacter sp.]